MRSKCPSSITNTKLVALHEAFMDELELITLETAFPYVVNDALNSPAPEIVPEMAHDLNVNGLEYLVATEHESAGSFTLRRGLLKDSFALHQRKGSAGIIEEIFLKTGRTDGKQTEWFEYSGSPYEYRIEIKTPLPKKESDIIFGLIKRYKRRVTKQITHYVNDPFQVKIGAAVRLDRVIKFPVQYLTTPFAILQPLNLSVFEINSVIPVMYSHPASIDTVNIYAAINGGAETLLAGGVAAGNYYNVDTSTLVLADGEALVITIKNAADETQIASVTVSIIETVLSITSIEEYDE